MPQARTQFQRKASMFESKTSFPSSDRGSAEPPMSASSYPPKQQRLMIAALTLLLFALGFVLYADRDFWFPDAPVAEEQSQPNSIVASTGSAAPKDHAIAGNKKPHTHALALKGSDSPEPSGATVTATRTVLPPLEVEVVAGSAHRTVSPANNSVQVDLQQGAAPSRAIPESEAVPETAASLTSNAAERVDVSADTADVVTHSVTPGYPTLARQMKVQGSVILLAMIGRDGLIQDLHVLSGPPILANAAQAAVREWHFKPHYQGADTVETQARITVNFTISTN